MLEEEKSNKQIGKFHSFFFCLFSKNLLEQDCNLEYYLISYLEDYPYSKTMDVCKDQKLLVVSLDQHRALHLQDIEHCTYKCLLQNYMISNQY